MKQAACLAFLLIFCKHCFCQNPYNIDSLLKVLPTQGEDSLKVRTLVRITNHYMLSDLPKAMEYSKQVYDLSNKIKWKKGCVLSYALTGSAYYYQGNFPQALIYRQKELKGWQEMGYKPQACMTLGNLATLYSDLGDNVKALEQYFITLQLANDTKDTETTTSTLCNIGVLYKDMGDTVKALNYLNRALKLSEIYGYRHLSSLNLINIGSIYSDRCQFSVALDYYSKALKIDEEQGNRQTLPGLLTNIAGIYQLQSDLAKKAGNTTLMNEKAKEAWHIFNKALNEARATDNLFIEASVLGDLAAINTSNKNFGEAEKDLKQSHALADSIGAVDLLISNHQRFYELYKGMKRYPEAFEHNERYMALKDSIYGLQNKNAISELQVKYDTEKKEAENNALAQKNKILELSVTNNRYLTFSLVTLCLLIIGIGYLVVRQNKLRSKQENARLEQKLLRTQMNPHFIFNSLANIESFIYEHQPKEAGDYLARFARLMRLILENSSSEYISLDKEIETLNYYFSLQKLRLNDNLEYIINVDKAIIPKNILLPPMLTQPFIENAIEHGFRGISETGKVMVRFALKENKLEIKIIDNGIGIAKAQQQKELYQKHNSMAIKITHERLKFLNRIKHQKLVFSIKEINSAGQKGTEVLFTIPV